MVFYNVNIVAFANVDEISSQYSKEELDMINSMSDINYSDIPEGIIPLKFESYDELFSYLKDNDLSYSYDEELSESVKQHTRITSFSNSQIKTGTNTYSEIKGPYRINLITTMTYTGNLLNRNIKTSSAGCTITGLTLGFDFSISDINSIIINNGKGFYSYANGTIDYYLIIEGGLKLFTRDFSIEHLKTYNYSYK